VFYDAGSYLGGATGDPCKSLPCDELIAAVLIPLDAKLFVRAWSAIFLAKVAF